MKIGIDARFYQQSGVGRYLRNLIYNLQLIDKKNQYFIFLNKVDFKDFKETSNFKKVLADFAWYGLSEQIKLPKLIEKQKLDLMHFPHFNTPIFYKGNFIVTIHDLIHQHFSMSRSTTLSPLLFQIKKWGYGKVFKTAVYKSKAILTPSKTVSDLLIKEWDVDFKKITVTREGVDNNILNISKKIKIGEIESVMKKFNIKNPYIFYVGNAHPHKNIEGLIKSFLILKKTFTNLLLVLSGYDHYFWERLKTEYKDKSIIYTNSISDKELVALYKKAQAFIMPSFEEGFGIPLLEAFVCGCPVASSNKGSLIEVGGDACIYFNPLIADDIVFKISKVLTDESLRKKLIIEGQKRVLLFSFKRLAYKTLEVYLKCK